MCQKLQLNIEEMGKLSNYSEYYCVRQWLRFEKTCTVLVDVMETSQLPQLINDVKRINSDNLNTVDVTLFLDTDNLHHQLLALQQLFKELCCRINESNQVNQLLNRISVMSIYSHKSEHQMTILNASRYKRIDLCDTKPFFQTIVGQYCQELTIQDNVDIDVKQSNFSGVEKLDIACTQVLRKFLQSEICCPKINKLHFNTLDENVLSFWKKHLKYLHKNNGKISLRINMQKLLQQKNDGINSGNSGNSTNNTNCIATLFTYIKNNGLVRDICISELSVVLVTTYQFDCFRNALISTTDFKSNIEGLTLKIGYGFDYNFTTAMGPTKLSTIFFDESKADDHIEKHDKHNQLSHDNQTTTRTCTPIINIRKLKRLKVMGMKRCNVENVWDLFTIVSHRAKISQDRSALRLRFHGVHIACTNMSSINQFLNLVYHIIVVIRYPVYLFMIFKVDKDHFEYDNQLSDIDKVLQEMKKQFDSFQEKVRVNYQQPLLKRLNCTPAKVPRIDVEQENNTQSDHSIILKCATSRWPS